MLLIRVIQVDCDAELLMVSGSDVICSETVMNPVQMYTDDHHVDTMSTDSHEEDEMRFIFTVRFGRRVLHYLN